jgi:hypothetical protein
VGQGGGVWGIKGLAAGIKGILRCRGVGIGCGSGELLARVGLLDSGPRGTWRVLCDGKVLSVGE